MSQKAKTVVAVSENWSYHPLVRAVAEYVSHGGIGEVFIRKQTKVICERRDLTCLC